MTPAEMPSDTWNPKDSDVVRKCQDAIGDLLVPGSFELYEAWEALDMADVVRDDFRKAGWVEEAIAALDKIFGKECAHLDIAADLKAGVLPILERLRKIVEGR